MSNKLLNILELSQIIRLTPGTIRVWLCRKKIPCVKMGRKVLFDEKDIMEWIEKKKIQEKEF
jgi:excisionase family DNA binding protein